MTGAPEGSPKVVLCGFLWFYGEAGNRTCDPWFTRHSAYPLHHRGKIVLDRLGKIYTFKANIISIDFKVNKLLILYGKDKTELDILDFSLISSQQEHEKKKYKSKKALFLGTISLISTILRFCVCHP